MVDGIDMSSILTPLPVGLGERKLVENVNDSGHNTALTLSILSQADHEFVTLEIERRAGQYYDAPAVKPLSGMAPQAKLNLMSADVLRHLQSFTTGQYIIAQAMHTLAEKVASLMAPGSQSSHLRTAGRHIQGLMEKSNEGFVSPAIVGTDLATTGHSALALSITPVGTLAVHALMYQLRNGGILIKQAQM